MTWGPALQGVLLSGRHVLEGVRRGLAEYRPRAESLGKRVAIIRFDEDPGDPPQSRARSAAARVSANQKVAAFRHVGFSVDHLVLSPRVEPAEFSGVVDGYNDDASVSSVVVQFPPPPRLSSVVGVLAPEKDLDALLRERSPYPACATAEGVVRVIDHLVRPESTIAVVGARGFVGHGVVSLLSAQERTVLPIDIGDDLRAIRDADIVVSATGVPHIVTDDHLTPRHRLVVDTGFVPRPDGSVAGDVHPRARAIPGYYTPVPGGIGPIEMAVLMERIVRQEIDDQVDRWEYATLPYRDPAWSVVMFIPPAGQVPDPSRDMLRKARATLSATERVLITGLDDLNGRVEAACLELEVFGAVGVTAIDGLRRAVALGATFTQQAVLDALRAEIASLDDVRDRAQ